MENLKLGQEPAFPKLGDENWNKTTTGISKRYLTAKDILCSVLSNPLTMDKFKNAPRIIDGVSKEYILIKGCYDWADLLLKHENE